MLNEKVALVTGASRGIGRSIALELAKNGANIVINYHGDSTLDEAKEVKQEIEELGVKAALAKGDVSSFEESKSIIDTAINEFGKIDILVNNAGITKDKLIMKMKEEEFDAVINVNLKGAFNMIKHVYMPMLKQKSGRIINISSVIGLMGNAGQANYAASKAGVIGLTKSTAKELGSRGITVNAVCPGFIQTNMTDVLSDNVKEQIASQIPMKTLGTPEDVANLVTFLASENAKYITGQAIAVDGGMVM